MTADPQPQPDDTDERPDSEASGEAPGEDSGGGGSKKVPRPRSGRKRKTGGQTPGERLAAAKAARAARKAKERGRDAEVLETEALKKADRATEWIAEHRALILGGLGLSFAAVAGFLLWSAQENSSRSEASASLWEAVMAAEGSDSEPTDEENDEEATTLAERAAAASEKYERVLTGHPGTKAATWAQLGLGAELLSLGKAEEARAAFGEALRIAGDDPFVEFRALEGTGFAYELEEKWDEAEDQFEQLRALGDPSFEDIADYHLARVNLRKENTDRAKELLSTLIARREGEREDDPELTFIENQARLRLTEIDPSFSSRSAPDLSSSLGNLDSLPPEIRELLRKQGGATP